jgi:hypothetical protein
MRSGLRFSSRAPTMSDHDDHFVMVWGDFWKSSILKEDVVTRFVFLACLDECDVDGVFRATPFFLARKCVIPEDQVEEALEALQRPDPDSTHKEHDGRRLVSEGSNLWRVPSYPEYRKRAAAAKARWLARERQRKKRERDDALQGVTERDSALGGVENRDPVNVNVNVPVNVPITPKSRKKVSERVDYEEEGFEGFWGLSWGRGSKKRAFETWCAMEAEDRAKACALVPSWTSAFETRDGSKRPHVVTWLNNRGWEDDLAAELAGAKGKLSNVGKHVEPTKDEAAEGERRKRVKQAIGKFRMRLMERRASEKWEYKAIDDAIEYLGELFDDKETAPMTLAQQFEEIFDTMMSDLADQLVDDEERHGLWGEAVNSSRNREVAERALAARLRKIVRDRLEIHDITDFDWSE